MKSPPVTSIPATSCLVSVLLPSTLNPLVRQPSPLTRIAQGAPGGPSAITEPPTSLIVVPFVPRSHRFGEASTICEEIRYVPGGIQTTPPLDSVARMAALRALVASV